MVTPFPAVAEVLEIELDGAGDMPVGKRFSIPEIDQPQTLIGDVVFQPYRVDQETR